MAVTSKVGRTNSYTKEKAERFCKEIAGGKSISKICSEHKDMPTSRTIAGWLSRYEFFFQEYMKAKAIAIELKADEMLELSDNVDDSSIAVQKARLQIDTRKWLAMKLLPKVYGDNATNVFLSGDTKVQIDKGILQAIISNVKENSSNTVDDSNVIEGEIVDKQLKLLPKIAATQVAGDCNSNPLPKTPLVQDDTPPQAKIVPEEK